ncbi:MAG: hypothetical protein LBR64_05785 [Dysgonamonadaceae bacterium]|nr:hypothetical protein [Dysgonamonadaceae bacterium]
MLAALFACHEEQTIPVEIDVSLHIVDDNHTAPLFVYIENNTRNADGFQWTFEGGQPKSSSLKNPDAVVFSQPGDHTITIEAWNDGARAEKSYTVRVDSAVAIDFETQAEINNYAPATFLITNHSTGGSSYKWTFDGGLPASYEGQYPPPVVYENEGKYRILLTINNGSAVVSKTKEIEVGKPLDASFTIIPSFEDQDDMEAPLRAGFEVWLQGVESLKWECPGAVITNPTSAEATMLFEKEGKYTVFLEVSNNKTTKRISDEISVLPNSNLRTHKDIHLGINTAKETKGAFYSTKLRKIFKASEINENNGNQIDIVYFGLNSAFSYNRFVSPNELDETTFSDIPNASYTHFINKTESCDIKLSAEQFDAMTTDALLRDLPIYEANCGDDFFSMQQLPRVVLFETADRRKGAILVKQAISDGTTGSYIIVDIKVQKND